MLGRQEKQERLFIKPIRLRQLIPEDHILVKADRMLRLGWLEEEVRPLYSEDRGRPSIPPEAAMRLMIAGLLSGITEDRKLMREAQVNIAIRWFSGYQLDDELPDHSSLTRIRQRWGEELYRKLFRRSVESCREEGLISGDTVHVDATLIRANASIDSIIEAHLDEVARVNVEAEEENDRGKGKGGNASSTDPDATMARSSRNDRFEPRYKQHMAVDSKCGVVVDVKVTTGKANESLQLVEQVKRVEETTGLNVERVTADAGYSTSENYRRLEEMGVEAVIPPLPERAKGKSISIRRFKYDGRNHTVKCPGGKRLKMLSANKQGWVFKARTSDCQSCGLKAACLPPSQRARSILIVFGYEALLRARRRRVMNKPENVDAMRRHRWLAEGRHAEAKNRHGLSRAVRRGLTQVSIQSLLTATVMNLKRLAASIFALLSRIRTAFRDPWTPVARFRSLLPICLSN